MSQPDTSLQAPLSKNKRKKLRRLQEASWQEVSSKPTKKRDDSADSEHPAAAAPAAATSTAPSKKKASTSATPVVSESSKPTSVYAVSSGPVRASDFNLDDVSDPTALLESLTKPKPAPKATSAPAGGKAKPKGKAK